MVDIPGRNVTPGLLRPHEAADLSMCYPILGLLKDLSSSDWLLLLNCAKGPHTVKNRKNSKSSFRTDSTVE